MSKLRQILQLLGDGMSQSKICAEVHCSKRTVSEASKLADVSGKGIGELLLLSDAELETVFTPGGEDASENVRKAQLAAMMPEIIKRLSRRHVHVQYVYETYYKKERSEGYGYTHNKKYILKPIVLSSSKCRCNTIGIRKFIRLQNLFLSPQGASDCHYHSPSFLSLPPYLSMSSSTFLLVIWA